MDNDRIITFCQTFYRLFAFYIMIRIFFLGDSKAGKTTIIDRYISGEFHDREPPTVNVGFYSKSLPNTGQSLKITDSSGQKKFLSFLRSYLHDIDVYVIVYDITNKNSFENLDNWLNLIGENSPTFIVGNKADLNDRREVSTDEGQNYADQHHSHFFEVSSFDGTNIDSLFDNIAQAKS